EPAAGPRSARNNDLPDEVEIVTRARVPLLRAAAGPAAVQKGSVQPPIRSLLRGSSPRRELPSPFSPDSVLVDRRLGIPGERCWRWALTILPRCGRLTVG